MGEHRALSNIETVDRRPAPIRGKSSLYFTNLDRSASSAQDAAHSENASCLARPRGFGGSVIRKSFKIKAGTSKVFTTERCLASPGKLLGQAPGGSDFWRWLIGQLQFELIIPG